ncbi:uncharacterized protein LOC105693541 isoform X2 [Athalia rosae]|uniref:uncharacterized protein LOC105693541 isoform X2 n=1 Tax=Athalia rosae TaxID=37344 RepID=UPI00203372BE|nr:uncharacterized protein LOC105693541 isoform X2 [Athalia rosae]
MNSARSPDSKYIVLVPQRKYLRKIKALMSVYSKPQQRRDYSEILRSQSTKATEHNHNRFFPNILKNPRSTESTFNNGISSDLDKQKTTNDNQAYEEYQNRGVTKRRRKQVLRCLQSNEGSSLKFQDSCENNHFHNFVSSPDIENYSVPDKVPKLMNHFVCNDLYTANLKSSCPTSNQQCAEHMATDDTSDQSIEIFNKNDVSDCENRISAKDPYFNVSKKDELLSSSNCSLAIGSSSSYGGTEIVEYDLNGNNIVSGERENQIYDSERKSNSDACQIDSNYNDGREEPNNTFLEQGQDPTFGSMNDSWVNEFDIDSLSIDNFDFDLNFDKLSSSTETASECDPAEEILRLRNFETDDYGKRQGSYR